VLKTQIYVTRPQCVKITCSHCVGTQSLFVVRVVSSTGLFKANRADSTVSALCSVLLTHAVCMRQPSLNPLSYRSVLKRGLLSGCLAAGALKHGTQSVSNYCRQHTCYGRYCSCSIVAGLGRPVNNPWRLVSRIAYITRYIHRVMTGFLLRITGMTPWSSVDRYRCLGGTCCLRL